MADLRFCGEPSPLLLNMFIDQHKDDWCSLASVILYDPESLCVNGSVCVYVHVAMWLF